VQLRQSEVDQIDLTTVALEAESEVGGLDVTMDIAAVVQVLDGVKHLHLRVAEERYQEFDGEYCCELFAFEFFYAGQIFAYKDSRTNTQKLHHDEAQRVEAA
jgi:hypothetical protein